MRVPAPKIREQLAAVLRAWGMSDAHAATTATDANGAATDAAAEPNHAETAGNTELLTDFPNSAIVSKDSRRSGRAVECAGLENR